MRAGGNERTIFIGLTQISIYPTALEIFHFFLFVESTVNPLFI